MLDDPVDVELLASLLAAVCEHLDVAEQFFDQRPERVVVVRRQRLRLLGQDENTDYVNIDAVSQEINEARRLCNKYNWPMINVSRRSIEETAAQILQLYQKRSEPRA